MKTYVITLSQRFPARHPRKGEPTDFDKKVLNAVWEAHRCTTQFTDVAPKLHTIRANYPLWETRFKHIEAGKAILSVRQWTGKPYCSKQRVICNLTAADGIGLQQLRFARFSDGKTYLDSAHVDGRFVQSQELAEHDGLDYPEWLAWFRSYDLTKPLAIIHFTNFRY